MKPKCILFLFGMFFFWHVSAMDSSEEKEWAESVFELVAQDDDLTDLGKVVKYGDFPSIKKVLDHIIDGEMCGFVKGKSLSFLEFLFLTRGADEILISGIVALLSHQKNGQRVTLLDVNAWERFSPLHAAAAYGYPNVVERLIDLGADLSAKTIDGASVLHCVMGKYNQVLFPKIATKRKLSLGRVSSDNFQLLAATGWMIKRSPPHGGGEEASVLSPRTDSRMNVLSLISRLEILNMVIEKTGPSIVYACDCSSKMPRDYDLDGSLTVFLDGCSEDVSQNKKLYEITRTDLMKKLTVLPKKQTFSMLTQTPVFSASGKDVLNPE